MRSSRVAVCILTACLILNSFGSAQEVPLSSAPASAATVPRLIRIRGVVRDETGKPLNGNIGITFSLYRDENDQVAVWQENQNLQLDSGGRYSALLGATNDAGLPLEIFSAGEARWLGVRPEGQSEQPRILFLSVAYALKAADTDLLGGKPASAFVLADGQNSSAQPASEAGIGSGSSQSRPQVLVPGSGALPLLVSPQTACSSITSDGTATGNQIAKFTSACNIENSAIFESGGNVGIGNTSPAGTLDVSGTAFVRGSLSALGGAVITPTGTATASQGYISNPLDIDASLFNTTLGRAANYIFRWQAEPVGNDTSSTSATLNLLYGVTGSISETGISVNKNGILSFASGQTFPGTGSGTVTSVGTGAGLTGGPITKSGTISIPSAGVTNSMLANNSITVQAGSGLSGGGPVALGGTVTLTNASPGLGGTVTSVGTGAGLTGGPITKSGTISIPSAGVTNGMLANNSITVQAGSGLSGGGTVSLGGTVTLAANLSGTTNGIAYFSNPANVISTPAPTNGQILIGSAGSAPVLSTLTAGQNVSITNGPGSVTISASGGGGGGTLPFFVTGDARPAASQAAVQNVTKLWGFLLPYNVTTTEITYDITIADNTANDYDIGIFTNAGALVVDIGPTPGTMFAPSKGFRTLAWTQGSTSLGAGRYYLAFTTNCSSVCAKVAAANTNISFAINASAGSSQGGALPSTITPPADSWGTGIQPAVVIH
ncbi:exported hypothetical protein [Candidatus Sulfotelmatobacter sp. SbA7]|nr:exported hypothetical protein [Candidatus Sulfotelmatobacter sp. SbA7]